MSMGMALYGLEAYLRQQYKWQPIQCGVQHRCLPPPRAGQFFVGIDDAGVEGGPAETNALTEVCNIEIGVWRRPGHLSQSDMIGKMKLPTDPYIAGVLTATKLERMVTIPTEDQSSLGLHQNYGAMNFINSLFGLPDAGLGDKFCEPLVFRGFSRFESVVIGEGKGAEAYYGRRLRFRGLKRIQKYSNIG
jgi:hypothetical protein